MTTGVFNSGKLFEVVVVLIETKTIFSKNRKQLKHTIMKTTIGILILALSTTTYFTAQAQRTVTTTRATSYDISDNLDLDAVASIFGQSKDLEDFEYRLNDPDNRISNLDLNEDGYIDYLRVIENSSNENSLVVIQAVLDKDIYQDVATIEIERERDGNHRIQIVGNDYIYGPNYIIEPVFVRRPFIFSFFWGPRYVAYYSPYYWNYYPRWYSYYRPYPTFRYHRHIYAHVDRHITFNHSNTRYFHFSDDRYNNIRRNDYASRYPDRTFTKRHEGVNNKYELNKRRSDNTGNYRRNSENNRTSDRRYQGTERNNTQRQSGEYRRPGNSNRYESNQIRTRENSNVRSNTNDVKVRQNSGSRERSNDKPSVFKSQSTPKSAPNRSNERIDQSRRSSAPAAKPAIRSNENKSKSAVKSASRSTKSAESRKADKKKDATERRR